MFYGAKCEAKKENLQNIENEGAKRNKFRGDRVQDSVMTKVGISK